MKCFFLPSEGAVVAAGLAVALVVFSGGPCGEGERCLSEAAVGALHFGPGQQRPNQRRMRLYPDGGDVGKNVTLLRGLVHLRRRLVDDPIDLLLHVRAIMNVHRKNRAQGGVRFLRFFQGRQNQR